MLEQILPVHDDCRHFRGEKPCSFKRHCPGCEHYDPITSRILIIKLGAMGDVLRTTPVLEPLRRLHPKAQITWMVKKASVDLLKSNPNIDVLWQDDATATRRLMIEEFDIAYNFDKEPAAIAAMMLAKAKTKIGFGLNSRGALIALNPESEYALALGVSDELKFRQNSRSYQEITFEMARLPYHREDYQLVLTDADRAEAESWRLRLGLHPGERIIGMNTGAGDVFATKRVSPERTASIAREIHARGMGRVLLLGGPEEEKRNREILRMADGALIDTGTGNSLRQFLSLLTALDLLICVDTLAMHVALALQKRVVVLFGPTCHQEVELYDRGEMLITSHPCAPCYRASCPYYAFCMEDIPLEHIIGAVERQLALVG